MPGSRFRILVCRGPECGERRGSQALREVFSRALSARGLDPRVDIGWQSCFGRCTQGPNVLVQELAAPRPEGRRFLLATMPVGRAGRSALYNHVTADDVELIVDQHVIGNRPVSRLIQPAARAARGYDAKSRDARSSGASPTAPSSPSSPVPRPKGKPTGPGSEGDS